MTRPRERTNPSTTRSSPVIAMAVGVFVLAAVGVMLWRAFSLPAGGEAPAPAPTPAEQGQIARPPTVSPTRSALVLGIAHTNDTWGYLFPCG